MQQSHTFGFETHQLTLAIFAFRSSRRERQQPKMESDRPPSSLPKSDSTNELSTEAVFGMFLTLALCLLTQPQGSLLHGRREDWMGKVLFLIWRLNPLACFSEAVAVFIVLGDTVRELWREEQRPNWSHWISRFQITAAALLLLRARVRDDDISVLRLLHGDIQEHENSRSDTGDERTASNCINPPNNLGSVGLDAVAAPVSTSTEPIPGFLCQQSSMREGVVNDGTTSGLATPSVRRPWWAWPLRSSSLPALLRALAPSKIAWDLNSPGRLSSSQLVDIEEPVSIADPSSVAIQRTTTMADAGITMQATPRTPADAHRSTLKESLGSNALSHSDYIVDVFTLISVIFIAIKLFATTLPTVAMAIYIRTAAILMILGWLAVSILLFLLHRRELTDLEMRHAIERAWGLRFIAEPWKDEAANVSFIPVVTGFIILLVSAPVAGYFGYFLIYGDGVSWMRTFSLMPVSWFAFLAFLAALEHFNPPLLFLFCWTFVALSLINADFTYRLIFCVFKA
jgi:hypothetical protein